MSRCLVTGATGFLGAFLVEALLKDAHNVTVLVRNTQSARVKKWMAQAMETSASIHAMYFDLTLADLGLTGAFEAESFDHVFHLAAIYDLDADPEQVMTSNVEGTRVFLAQLADAGFRGCFHFVSSIAVAGNYRGDFDETMFAEGQKHDHVYHLSKYESESVVREYRSDAQFRIRIYRPSAIVGHSQTGHIDKVDGPYYLFNMVGFLKRLVPAKIPLLLPKTKVTLDMVPVDYVVQALVYLSHLDEAALPEDQFCFHLTNPDSPSLSALFKMLLACADGPGVGMSFPVDGLGSLAALKQVSFFRKLKALEILKNECLKKLQVPESVFDALMPHVSFNAQKTIAILASGNINLPDTEAWLENLWNYYAKHLDPFKNRMLLAKKAFKGKRILITGGSSGIGFESAKLAYLLGAKVLLVARDTVKLAACKREIEATKTEGGTISTYSCDLAEFDQCDGLIKYVIKEWGGIDILFSNAGKSIRRSIARSDGRFHDLERTMQLNYFGAARLMLGLLPVMRSQEGGHILHSSSMGTLCATPRFGPYMASKIALDTLMDAMAAEFVNQNIYFSSIKFPLVKTPMVAPTAEFKEARLTSPEKAAKMFMDAVIDKDRHKMTGTGSLLSFVAWFSPNFMTLLYNYGFQIWPDDSSEYPEMALDRMLMKYFIPHSPL